MAQVCKGICLQCSRPGFDPWLGRSPGEGNGYPLQYSCLKIFMDGGDWLWSRGLQSGRHDQATNTHTPTHTHTHTHTHTQSYVSILCLHNIASQPGTSHLLYISYLTFIIVCSSLGIKIDNNFSIFRPREIWLLVSFPQHNAISWDSDLCYYSNHIFLVVVLT